MTAETVLHVIASTNRRGAEVFAADLSSALVRRGWTSHIASLVSGHGVVLPVPALGKTTLGPRTLARLRHLLSSQGLVIGHGSSTLPACTLARVGLSTKFVYRSIGDPAFWQAAWSRRERAAQMLRRADAVVVLWPGAADTLVAAGLDPRRIRVIPNGVRSDQFPLVDPKARQAARSRLGLRLLAEGERVVVYVGALTPEKDVGRIIRAVASTTNARLLVAGGGPLRASLEDLAASTLKGRTHFLGPVSDVTDVIAAADILMLSSRTEGMPAVLIEAGLSGVPVVATDVGAVRTVVIDGVSGRIVPPDDQDALDHALGRALEDPPPAGEQARRHCLEHFSLDVIAESWESLIAAIT